jgi:MiaB/RimO family radical SAM methylthiotransferase
MQSGGAGIVRSAARRACASLNLVHWIPVAGPHGSIQGPCRGRQLASKGASGGRRIRWLPDDDKTLAHFLPGYTASAVRRSRPAAALSVEAAAVPHTEDRAQLGAGLRVFVETRGCQMNVADSDVIRSLLSESGYELVNAEDDAHIMLINTCAIRERAEDKVWQWLHDRRSTDRKLGRQRRVYALLGCMAERLKHKILEQNRLVDVVVGPDAYRDLPWLLVAVTRGEPGAVGYNIQLSLDETYADITPLRENVENKSAFVSIARSCGMHCTFCIVPFTRGPERSRPMQSILSEVRNLVEEQGVKEITLLGQNVNSWRLGSESEAAPIPLSRGFHLPGRTSPEASVRFPDLLDAVSRVDPEVRIRFTSPHPAHFPDDVIQLMAERKNICSSIHLPAQSGSNAVLDRMKRRYTVEAYKDLVANIRGIIPDVALSTDIISGFCGETEDDHQATLALLRSVTYDHGFFFAYSARDKTEAARLLADDVPMADKQRRLREVIDVFHELALEKNRAEIGRHHLVLVEHGRPRSPATWAPDAVARTGRTDTNKRVIFTDAAIPFAFGESNGQTCSAREQPRVGDYVAVRVTGATSGTLFAETLYRTTIADYYRPDRMSLAYPRAASLPIGMCR